jgi:iron complex outermembrane receptor protein
LKNLGGLNVAAFRVTNIQHWREGGQAWAAYADGTYHFTDRLALNLGARYSQDHKEVRNFVTSPNGLTITTPIQSADADFSAFTPRASLRYELANHTNVYASYSKGYRTGGFNPVPGSPLIPFKPEKITAYEVGFKTAQAWYRFDTAAFYYDYRDMQVGVTVPNPDPRVGGVTNLTLNAKKAEVYGVDANLDLEPIENLHVRAGAAWLHGRYTDFHNATGVGLNPVTGLDVTQTQDWTGLQMARAPKFAGNLGVDYTIRDVAHGDVLLATNATYTDSFPLSNPSVFGALVPSAAREQRYLGKAYTLLNAQATWTDSSSHYKVTVYGNNLFDVKYRITFNGNAATGDYNSWSEPRTYGVRVGYSF